MIIAIIDHERGIPSKCESSARVDYVPALCTHRPSLLPIERFSEVLGLFGSRITLTAWREDDQTVAFRGSKSRNKVSVGEPAEGSLPLVFRQHHCELYQTGGVTKMVLNDFDRPHLCYHLCYFTHLFQHVCFALELSDTKT